VLAGGTAFVVLAQPDEVLRRTDPVGADGHAALMDLRNNMIARIWKARALPADVDAYLRHFRERVQPELAGIDGHEGALVLKREAGAHVELTVMTLWKSMDAIEAFAGNPSDRAVVESAARAVLLDYDRTVQQLEVIHSSSERQRS
jgi:heme-degrading monooxygenase HmoA